MESFRAPARRRAMRALLGAGALTGSPLVGSLLVGSLLVATASVVSATAAPRSPSAAALYAKAFSDAAGVKGVRITGTIASESYLLSATEDAGAHGGKVTESITAGSVEYSFTERLIGSKLYLNGDQDSLETVLQLDQTTAAFDAGYWRTVPVTSKYYESLAYGLNLPTSLDLIGLGPPFAIAGPTRYDGQEAYAISSTLGLHAGTASSPLRGRYTLYVGTGPKPYPIAETGRVVVDSTAEVVVTNFSHWGEQVTVTPPKIVPPV